jgi:SAM-dependent methyltransferase
MVLVLLPTVSAQADSEIEIANYEQLKAFAARVNGGEKTLNAKLTEDITCTDKTWTPIGDERFRYDGTFDGQGYKIIGLSNADVDYSGLSVAKASEYNRDMIALGRCKVLQGDVSDLHLPAEKYDLATAFETIYFWPGLEKCFGQVAKVLKPGGYFLICNESDGTDATGLKFEKIIDGMKCHTVEEIESALKNAGFSKVKSGHHKSKPWITVIAQK